MFSMLWFIYTYMFQSISMLVMLSVDMLVMLGMLNINARCFSMLNMLYMQTMLSMHVWVG